MIVGRGAIDTARADLMTVQGLTRACLLIRVGRLGKVLCVRHRGATKTSNQREKQKSEFSCDEVFSSFFLGVN